MYLNTEVASYSLTTKWSLRLGFFMTLYVISAAALLPQYFIGLIPVYADKFLTGIPILFVVGIGAAALMNGRRAPTRYVLNLLREQWLPSLLILVFFYFSLIAFNTYRIALPVISPYYADRGLADLDEWLFGVAPWELAHRLDNPVWSAVVLNCYQVIWFFQWLGTVLFISLWADRTAGVRYLWAASLTLCILGTVMATALSSVGPIFYHQFLGDHRFYGLKVMMNNLDYSYMVREPAVYLLRAYRSGQPEIGGGITAMPSMHVAFAILNAFLLSSINRWLGTVGLIFAAIIGYGSVYTGWHYAVDGIVSIIVVSIFWLWTGRIMRGSASIDVAGSVDRAVAA